MKILIICSGNASNFSFSTHQSFVYEQIESIKSLYFDLDYEVFALKGKGFRGYCKQLYTLKRKIKTYTPDLIHAHYGLSGLFANLQRTVPVITTYHGSDIHTGGWLLKLSKTCMRLSVYNIFVAEYLYKLSAFKKNNYNIQACGLDLETIIPIEHKKARNYFGWDLDNKYVLFSGSFSNSIKNYPLAKEATEKLKGVKLIELKGYTRQEVALLMNACDCLLLTSFREASPTVIKEAMACNRPIVATDVGDARWVMGDTEGCYVSSYDADDCAEKLMLAIEFSKKQGATKGRERIISIGLDSKEVAEKIVGIYNNIIKK